MIGRSPNRRQQLLERNSRHDVADLLSRDAQVISKKNNDAENPV